MSRFPPLVDVSDEIAAKNVAATFTESDVSVTSSNAEATGEELKLPVESDSVDITASSSSGTSSERGIVITLDANAGTVTLSAHPNNSNISTIYLRDPTDDSLITSKSYDGSGSVSFSNLSAGDYVVTADNGGNSWTNAILNDAPHESEFIEVTTGFNSAAPDNRSSSCFTFDQVSISNSNPPNTATAYIEWTEAADVFRWDATTFQRTLDGETVGIDIQEDDGSGWTTIASNIDRGQDITADPSSRVRLVAQIDRSDSTKNPTLDAIARRWVL